MKTKIVLLFFVVVVLIIASGQVIVESNMIERILSVKTSDQLHSIDAKNLNDEMIIVKDKHSGGFFVLDSSDHISENNGATVIVTKDKKRYRRLNYGTINVKWFGVKGDGRTFDSDLIQKAINYCSKFGLGLFFPSGIYIIDKPLEINLNNKTGNLVDAGARFSLTGENQMNVIFDYVGKSNNPAIDILGTYDDMFNISNIRITRPVESAYIGTAISIRNLVNFEISKLSVSYFENGIVLSDVNEGMLSSVTSHWNKYGISMSINRKGKILPNAIKLLNCSINSNKEVGLKIEDGCSISIDACRFLGNGMNKSGRAIQMSYIGVNGAVSTQIENSYFEGNVGEDVELKIASAGSHVFTANTFNKNSNNRYANCHIHIIPVNLVAGDGKVSKVLFLGNSMFSADYTPDVKRKCIILDYGNNGYNGFDVYDSNYYQNKEESPVYPELSYKYESQITRTNNIMIDNGDIRKIALHTGKYYVTSNVDGMPTKGLNWLVDVNSNGNAEQSKQHWRATATAVDDPLTVYVCGSVYKGNKKFFVGWKAL